ncbi:MAG: phosphoribosyltransferase family protein [Synechococcaceae cyanobacterium]|nr:phosphoribosyltransferase family protein [Synechococcaceae cyanobacterium]
MDRTHRLWYDRREAGRGLARRFTDLRGRAADCTLVALPRGGVPVGAEMARELGLPLVTWAVRKVAHPSYPEYALGAVAPGGVVLWDEPDGGFGHLGEEERQRLVAGQQAELERRRQAFGDPQPAELAGRHLIVVDDGVATGMTTRAALRSLRLVKPASLALAVPVVDRRVVPTLEAATDRLEVLAVVDRLRAVGEWYEHFEQLSDADVLRWLERCRT